MYLLFALTAGLVGCFHINHLYKFSEGVWREFRECGVSAYPLNKLFKVFYLPFLYFDFFLQIYDFNFILCRRSRPRFSHRATKRQTDS